MAANGAGGRIRAGPSSGEGDGGDRARTTRAGTAGTYAAAPAQKAS
jgi:hypothetical protein